MGTPVVSGLQTRVFSSSSPGGNVATPSILSRMLARSSPKRTASVIVNSLRLNPLMDTVSFSAGVFHEMRNVVVPLLVGISQTVSVEGAFITIPPLWAEPST